MSRRAPLALIPRLMPAPGDRIGAEYGPGEFAAHNAGIVICLIEHCSGLNRGPGIGWHMVSPAAKA